MLSAIIKHRALPSTIITMGTTLCIRIDATPQIHVSAVYYVMVAMLN